VLVTESAGRPAPKVIDFGIAKATHAELTAKTLLTQEPEGSWQLYSLQNLGQAIAAQGRFAEAEPLLIQAAEEMLKNPRPEERHMTTAGGSGLRPLETA
jgi:hypothetical protein